MPVEILSDRVGTFGRLAQDDRVVIPAWGYGLAAGTVNVVFPLPTFSKRS